MLAIANGLEGMSRAQAARAAGIERQSLRDAVLRFNVEGLAGLVDRPHGHRPEVLSEGEQAVLVYQVLRGPDPEQGEPSSWTLPDLCRFIEERFGKTLCPQSMSRVGRRLGLSRQKARPVHPKRNARAAELFAQRGFATRSRRRPRPIRTSRSPSGSWTRSASVRRGGQGSAGGCRGQRPPGLCDKRFASASLFAAVQPATGEDFCLVLPRVYTEAVDRFLVNSAGRASPSAPLRDRGRAGLVIEYLRPVPPRRRPTTEHHPSARLLVKRKRPKYWAASEMIG